MNTKSASRARPMSALKIDTDKLEIMFKERYERLRAQEEKQKKRNPSFFVDWCDEHKIIILNPEWLADTLNDGKMRGMICICSPEEYRPRPPARSEPEWLLVPKKFAEKCLVLGGLP